jgi:hypothetical protein
VHLRARILVRPEMIASRQWIIERGRCPFIETRRLKRDGGSFPANAAPVINSISGGSLKLYF